MQVLVQVQVQVQVLGLRRRGEVGAAGGRGMPGGSPKHSLGHSGFMVILFLLDNQCYFLLLILNTNSDLCQININPSTDCSDVEWSLRPPM